VNVVVERSLGKGCALEAAVAQKVSLEAQCGQARQHHGRTNTIIDIGRGPFEIKQRAVFVAQGVQLYAFDQLATIDAARKTAWRGALRAAVHDHGRGQRVVAAGPAPVESQTLPEPAP
jgi:hypothetical protein